MTNLKSIIGFVGMTHLGLNSAVAAAEKGYRVICFDPDAEIINNLVGHRLIISEPGLETLLKKNEKNIEFNSDLKSLEVCDLIYVAPDVATDDLGNSDLTLINYLLDRVVSVASSSQTIIILSQVPPGFSRQKNIPKVNLYYQVETLIFGQAIDRALYPERFIVGCLDPRSELPKPYLDFLLSHSCPILKMGYESAELAKISINMFLVASVTTSNTLAELCETIGANWSEIVPALRLDKRIGEHAYLRPGLGISGGNLERDLVTVKKLSKKKYTESGIVDAWMVNSKHRKNWIWNVYNKLKFDRKKTPRIGILGITYKENTHSIKNSPALVFISKLYGLNIFAYDPLAADDSIPSYVTRVNSSFEVISKSDILVLATAWDEFKSISMEQLIQHMPGRVIIDPYSLLPKDELEAHNFVHYSLGSPVSERINL